MRGRRNPGTLKRSRSRAIIIIPVSRWRDYNGRKPSAAKPYRPALTNPPSTPHFPATISPPPASASTPAFHNQRGCPHRNRRQARLSQGRSPGRLSESARLNIATAAWQVRSHLRSSLIDFTAANARTTLLQKQNDLQQRILNSLQQQLQAGAVSTSEVTLQQIALAKGQLDFADARRQAADSRVSVADAIGVPSGARRRHAGLRPFYRTASRRVRSDVHRARERVQIAVLQTHWRNTPPASRRTTRNRQTIPRYTSRPWLSVQRQRRSSIHPRADGRTPAAGTRTRGPITRAPRPGAPARPRVSTNYRLGSSRKLIAPWRPIVSPGKICPRSNRSLPPREKRNASVTAQVQAGFIDQSALAQFPTRTRGGRIGSG